MSEIKIEKRKISKSDVTRKLASGKTKVYPQYRLNIPAKFVEEHGKEVYLIADSVGMFIPDEKTLMEVLKKFPELRKLVIKLGKKKKGVNKKQRR